MAAREKSAPLLIPGCNPPNPVVVRRPLDDAERVTGRRASLSECVRLSEEQRLDWLRLIRTDNIGPRTFHDLVNHYGGALPVLARRGGTSAPARICSREDAETEMKAARAASTSSRSASWIIRRACR